MLTEMVEDFILPLDHGPLQDANSQKTNLPRMVEQFQ